MTPSPCCRYSIVSAALCLTLLAGSAARAEFEFAGRPWLGKHSVYSTRGIVSTMHPLASQAGIEIMKRGGNAFDAGIAAALVLSAVEGWMGGPGGSSFYLVYRPQDREVVALDACNLAPEAASAGDFSREMLSEGVTSMGIPGTMAGYWTIVERYGRLNFAQVAAPALAYLEDGFPLTPAGAGIINALCGHCPSTFPNFARVFAPLGHFPGVGGTMKNPELARTYRRIAAEGIDVFYKGAIAKEMVDYVRAQGGLWSEEDLASYQVVQRRPLHMTYRGYDVYGCPPPSSSITWMQILKMLEAQDLRSLGRNSTAYIHRFTEAQKLAHADAYHNVSAPAFVEAPLEALLSDAYAEVQRRRIDPGRAAAGRVRYGDAEKWSQNPAVPQLPLPLPALPPRSPRTLRGAPQEGSTSHLIAADAEGNCLTFTHTLGNIFGGHDVLGTTGVLGSNSMDWFDLDDNVWSGEPSNLVLKPGKRNRFTLSPGMVFKDGKPIVLVGGSAAETTMPGIAQVLLNMLDFGLDPQSAIEAPRVVYGDILHWTGGSTLHLDPEIRAAIGDSLTAIGHVLAEEPGGHRPIVGMVNAVSIDPQTGHFAGGAEIRADGHVSGY